MSESSYLLFALHNRQYSLPSDQVAEIFLIPMITPVVAVRPDLLGMINVRGQLYPVLDLSYRLGLGHHQLKPSDSIIMLRQGDRCVAIAISEVFDVVALQVTTTLTGAVVPIQNNGTAAPAPHTAAAAELVAGMTHRDGIVITLLDPEPLFAELPQHRELELADLPPEQDTLFPTATEAERDRLEERAANLRHAIADEQADQLTPLAIVELQDEPLALPIAAIREFTSVRAVTPIPCCPAYVIGNMNLRGEILTLLDIQPLLQGQSSQTMTWAHAVVVEVEDIVAGIVVDAVLDVRYVPPEAIQPMPIATVNHQESAYLRGVVNYGDRPIRVLDLQRLLTNPDLVVNDAAA